MLCGVLIAIFLLKSFLPIYFYGKIIYICGKILGIMKSKIVFVRGEELSRAYETASEAAVELGISKASVSKALCDGRKVKGMEFVYAPRVYAAKVAGGSWILCSYDPVKKRCIGINSKMPLSGVEQLRDVTGDFYSKEVKL